MVQKILYTRHMQHCCHHLLVHSLPIAGSETGKYFALLLYQYPLLGCRGGLRIVCGLLGYEAYNDLGLPGT